MVEAAKAQTTDPTLIDAVSELRKEYAQATRSMVEQPAIEDEHSVLKPEDTLLEVDLLKRIRAEIELAIYTGMLDGKRWEPKDVHTAMVAYGPPRLVAKYCPPEVFERLGQETTRTFVALIGHGWETRDYLIEELNAIPTCKNDTAGFCKGKKHVHVTVVSLGPQTTRVMLTAC
jgi:hypothetical protein